MHCSKFKTFSELIVNVILKRRANKHVLWHHIYLKANPGQYSVYTYIYSYKCDVETSSEHTLRMECEVGDNLCPAVKLKNCKLKNICICNEGKWVSATFKTLVWTFFYPPCQTHTLECFISLHMCGSLKIYNFHSNRKHFYFKWTSPYLYISPCFKRPGSDRQRMSCNNALKGGSTTDVCMESDQAIMLLLNIICLLEKSQLFLSSVSVSVSLHPDRWERWKAALPVIFCSGSSELWHQVWLVIGSPVTHWVLWSVALLHLG